LFSTLDRIWYGSVRGIRWVPFLNFTNYVKADALKELEREVGYKPYPYKHYESVFTRFYQAVILPRKFGFDKRRVHLSALVVSGQMDRAHALAMLEHSPYPDREQELQDLRFVKKKLGFGDEEFEAYLAAPPAPHAAFRSEKWLWDTLDKVRRIFSRSRAKERAAGRQRNAATEPAVGPAPHHQTTR